MVDLDSRWVFNLFAQFDYGITKRQLNYGAIGMCLDSMSRYVTEGEDTIGFPYKIGCDRAGGDWNIVLEMIKFYFKNYDVKIYNLGG
jgi:hypothetical protein